MESKTLQVLEYEKILARLAGYCDFSASAELARALQPTSDCDEATRLLNETSEARLLLSTHDMSVGGSHDIRPAVELGARGGVIDPHALLDIKATLIACREIRKSLVNDPRYPRLSHIAAGLPETFGIVDAITRVLSDRGEVLDSASPRLADIRHDLKIAHDRLMSRLQRYLTESANKLQEPIITQRDGRYVIPLRAEFKGQIKAIVHDQSSTGATLFVEPLPVVELNNEIRELELQERDEERRILAELSGVIGAHHDELVYGVENLAVLDLAFAKAKYAEEIHASEPVLKKLSAVGRQRSAKNIKHEPTDEQEMSGIKGQVSGGKPQASEGRPTIKLLQARHPLLDPARVVPVDIDPKPGTHALVITGPNTGGKTVSLKTVGLLVLMAQSGLHIPAESGSELPCFEAVYADIGDEQSIEQSLSTFSGHITNIIHILKLADARSLVILDELGAGTDPQEGAALARVILRTLIERGVTTFVATHYPELKTFAHTTEGVVNASLEFDVQTLRPTYRLTIGLPGRSNALLIAQRLGMDPQLVQAARGEVNPDDLRADKLLDDIRKERNRTSREREKLEKARTRLETQTQELNTRLDKMEDERREVLARTRAEGELEVAVLKENVAALKAQLRKARQPLDALKDIEQRVEHIQEKIAAPVERQPQPELRPSSLKLGERVFLRTLNSEGILTALGEQEAEVQIGTLRVRAKLSDLERATSVAERAQAPRGAALAASPTRSDRQEPEAQARRSSIVASPGMEINLRGKLVEDGLDELEKYLEKAYAAGLPFVRIVHGKGTGRMREAVRLALKEHPYVKSFEEADEKEGGAGVTIANFAH